MEIIKTYYRLAKPGIVYGNVMTTIAAYLYVSRWQLDSWPVWVNFLAAIIGVGLVIASACVCNNYIDRDIDAKMERTKVRALPAGVIWNTNAILFGVVLGVLGFMLLLAFVNILTTAVAAAGFLVYVFAYTYSKRTTSWATEIGSIAGAMPIVAGYTAFTGHLGWAALILFLILVFWQMPHFYAIAMFRADEYAAADIPVLPLTRGWYETKLRSLVYILLFALSVFALTFFSYAGFIYLVVIEGVSLSWFGLCVGSRAEQVPWARGLFRFSLIVLLTFSAMLSVALVLP